jgi:hypothetical protein
MTPATTSVLSPEIDRSTQMYLYSEALARELVAARLAEAERERRRRLLVTAARLGRKAEQAAYDARLALARVGA